MRVFRRQQAQELDRISMDKMGVSGITLMGNAGHRIAEAALEVLGDNPTKRIAICCGKGNNGGDGFAAALHLTQYEITIFSIPFADIIQGDSKHYFVSCLEKGIPIIHGIELPESNEYDLVIDALLGTGFHGELRTPISNWTDWMNSCPGKILSADVPSGVDADSGTAAEGSVTADITITMGHAKTGLMLNPGSGQSGKIIPVDIGFPNIYDQLTGDRWNVFNDELCYKWLSPPPVDTYKHRQGKVLIVSGSTGMTGAASLSTYGALRSGAGLTVTCAPESLNPIYEANIIEGMTLSCPDEGKGYLDEDNFKDMECMFDWADVLMIGPGLGGNLSTVKLVERIVTSLKVPMVIDADALRIFANDQTLINELDSEFVLTPHYGELAAILGKTQDSIKENFPSIFEDLLKSCSGVIVAKNAPTCIGKTGEIVINNSGHQGLAAAGTGDVLAGLIAGLISQGIPIFEASQIGVYLHGKAADILLPEKGYRGLISSDLLDQIPKVIRRYELA